MHNFVFREREITNVGDAFRYLSHDTLYPGDEREQDYTAPLIVKASPSGQVLPRRGHRH